jgi:gamma-glutamylputrescine oxidase
MTHQSPISPGISWYEASLGERPRYAALAGDTRADVVIIGGGFTGLSAAAHLAKAGCGCRTCRATPVWRRRVGPQWRPAQHRPANSGIDELEKELGWTRAKALFDLAEEAKAHLLDFSRANGIEIDYRAGHMSVAHKKRYVADYRAYCDYLTDRVGYPHVSFMDAAETEERVGSKRYFGGMRDMGTGHIHPLKLVVGTARVAAEAGARLHEERA